MLKEKNIITIHPPKNQNTDIFIIFLGVTEFYQNLNADQMQRILTLEMHWKLILC